MMISKTAVTAALAAVLFAIVAAPASAGNLDIVVNGKSHHINSRYDWNENNLGLGLEYEFSGSSRWVKSLHANTFMDSLENMSYMAGAGLKRRLFDTDRYAGFYIDAGIVGFLMARKDMNDYRPFPGVLPVVTVGNRYAGMNITYLPKQAVHDMARANVVDPTIGGVVFLQFKLRADAFRF
jgi:Antimicrobial peptide resistance and lipid A acylation protein PagP